MKCSTLSYWHAKKKIYQDIDGKSFSLTLTLDALFSFLGLDFFCSVDLSSLVSDFFPSFASFSSFSDKAL